MPMGVVSDEDFEKELEISQKPSSDGVPPIITPVPNGRGKGNVGVPEGLRKIIGETSVIDGREEAIALARHFGISNSSVSAYANGSTSTASYDKQPNLNVLNDARARIAKLARIKLKSSLKHITDDKLRVSDASELSTISKNLSAVVKDMEPVAPRGEGVTVNAPQYIVYSPTLKKEENYEIVFARE